VCLCACVRACVRCVCLWLLSHSLRSLVQGTVREPVEFYQKFESNAGAWGKAVATIDASAVRVFADKWCLDSFAQGRKHVKEEGSDALFSVVRVPNSRSMLYVNLVRIGMVSDRVFATWFSWRQEEDGSFVMAWAPLEDYAEESADAFEQVKNYTKAQETRRSLEGDTPEAYRRDAEDLKRMMEHIASKNQLVKDMNGLIKQDPLAEKALRGKVRGFWRMKPLAPSVCQVTYLAQVELAGSIPTALLNARIKNSLSGFVQTMQVKFARNGKLVDKEMRGVFASPPPLAELSEEQMSVFEDCRSLESEDGREWETLASPSPLVAMYVKHAPVKENERTIAIGKATAVIDCPVHEAVGESSKAIASRAARRTLRTSDRRHSVLNRLV